MPCTRRFLSLNWSGHDWQRQVTHTEDRIFRDTDMWGRRFPEDQVLCRTREVCLKCGEVRNEEYCGCDPDRADRCAVRLAYLKDRAASPDVVAGPQIR